MKYVDNTNNTESILDRGKHLFALIASIRCVSAIYSSLILDCDETYNYLEPLHFLVNGYGFQTWEYDPKFGLRSYFYILLHFLPTKLMSILSSDGIIQFYCLRIVLALICASCETFFVRSVKKAFGRWVAWFTLVFLIGSSGMFFASTAFLPSSTSMYLTMLSHGMWWRRRFRGAIFFTALSAIVSWPFTAALGLPLAVDIVVRSGRIAFFAKWSLTSLIVIAFPMASVDFQFYNKLTLASWNIIKYNVFTSHGPNLYGSESWMFYFKNCLLNFNILFIFSMCLLMLPPFCLRNQRLLRETKDAIFKLSSTYIWLLIFQLQSHKEERFLYPIYPLICTTAAIFVPRILTGSFSGKFLRLTVLTTFLVLSFLRILGLIINFGAPFNVYGYLSHRVANSMNSGPELLNVCVGKEWYRFPSHFFLENSQAKFRVRFLKSEFRGQLPKLYDESSGDGVVTRSTSKSHPTFNDQNMEAMDRYINKVAECHFIIDLEGGGHAGQHLSSLEPAYSTLPSFKIIYASRFLDVSRTDRIFRMLYIPFLTEKYASFSTYVLLQNVELFNY